MRVSLARPLLMLWSQPLLTLSVAMAMWASNFVIGRLAVPDLPPVALCFWRFLGATVLLLPWALSALRRDWPILRDSLGLLLLLAAAGFGGCNLILYVGLHGTTASTAMLVSACMPVAVLILAWLLFGQVPRPAQTIGILIAACGVLLVARGGLQANVLVIAATLLQALYVTLLSHRRPAGLHPLSFLCTVFALATLELLPLQAWHWITPTLAHPKSLLTLLYLAAGPSVIAFLCFNRGVALIGASRAALCFCLMPVFGTLFAVLLLGEHVIWPQLAGFAVIALGFATSRVGQPPRVRDI